MIVTTTPTVEGYPVTQYLRVGLRGEPSRGSNFLKDVAGGVPQLRGRPLPDL